VAKSFETGKLILLPKEQDANVYGFNTDLITLGSAGKASMQR